MGRAVGRAEGRGAGEELVALVGCGGVLGDWLVGEVTFKYVNRQHLRSQWCLITASQLRLQLQFYPEQSVLDQIGCL